MKKTNVKKERLKKHSNKGITLIALVITIIVLLILAGVSIAMLTGENGVLTKATESKEETEIGQEKEEIKMAYAAAKTGKVDKIAEDVTEDELNAELTKMNSKGTASEDGELTVTFENGHKYTINQETGEITGPEIGEIPDGGGETTTPDGVTVPKGFYYVGGTKEEGIVISDNSADAGRGTSHEVAKTLVGNQFVWVPVDKNTFKTKFKRTKVNDGTEIYFSEVGADGKNTISEVNESLETSEEAKKVYASVQKNGGFYIGRYETGLIENQTIVIKQGVQPYNNIPWSSSEQLDIDTGGAVEKARNFANSHNYSSVTSTLCYGVEWDAALNFIDPNYITNETNDGYPNCDSNSFVINSTNKGNYNEDENINDWKGKATLTGSLENYQEKNIYDMGGNLREWTMEVFYSPASKSRVLRGGCYALSGKSYSASARENYTQSTNYGSFGFRICLYLN